MSCLIDYKYLAHTGQSSFSFDGSSRALCELVTDIVTSIWPALLHCVHRYQHCNHCHHQASQRRTTRKETGGKNYQVPHDLQAPAPPSPCRWAPNLLSGMSLSLQFNRRVHKERAASYSIMLSGARVQLSMVLSKNVEILENVENLEVRKRCCALPGLMISKNQPLQVE